MPGPNTLSTNLARHPDLMRELGARVMDALYFESEPYYRIRARQTELIAANVLRNHKTWHRFHRITDDTCSRCNTMQHNARIRADVAHRIFPL